MSWDFGNMKPFDISVPLPEDAILSNTYVNKSHTRSSSCFDNSVLRRNSSSVLSSLESPSDFDAFMRQSMKEGGGGNIYEGRLVNTQQELETVISKLNAIYLYRQGLKALTQERLANTQSLRLPMDSWIDNGHPQIQASVLPPPLPLVPSTVPGSANSIWRMDADSLTPSLAAKAVSLCPLGGESVDGNNMVLKNYHHQQNQQDVLYKHRTVNRRHHSIDATSTTTSTAAVNAGHIRQRRKHHRQNSAPVNLSAPQWADASWNPRLNLRGSNQLSNGHGTGVFLPPHLSQSSMVHRKEAGQHQQ
eukprot:g4681.t1